LICLLLAAVRLQAAPQSITGQLPLQLTSGMSIEGSLGGVLVAGSRAVETAGGVSARLTKLGVPDIQIDRLLVNGQPQPMARFPNFDIDARHWNGVSGDATSEARIRSCANPLGGYLHAMHRSMWGDFHYKITGKDDKGELILEGGWQNNRQMGMHQQYRFVEGIREELDAPGEWWQDGETSEIFWIPDVEGLRLKAEGGTGEGGRLKVEGGNGEGTPDLNHAHGQRPAEIPKHPNTQIPKGDSGAEKGNAGASDVNLNVNVNLNEGASPHLNTTASDARGRAFYDEPSLEEFLANAEFAVVDADTKHLVEIIGRPEEPVRDVLIENVTFRHTARTFMDTKEPLLRSDWCIYRGGAILIENAENVTIRNCTFEQLGGNAIFVSGYAKNIRIEGCTFRHIGASAVCFVGRPESVRNPLFEYHQTHKLEELDQTPGPREFSPQSAQSTQRNEEANPPRQPSVISVPSVVKSLAPTGDTSYSPYPRECVVTDCLIYDIGQWEKQSAGVQISMAMDITVSHCSIYQTPRAGINVSEGAFGGHIIEHNDVFDTVRETGDHGSFNSWGRDRFWHRDRRITARWVKQHPDMPFWDCIKPIIIRNNRFRCDNGWDIDLDDGASNYIVENNLCLAGGIKLREGYGRVVRNNILVNNSIHPHVWYPKSGDIIERNILFGRYKPIRVYDWGKSVDYNYLHAPSLSSDLKQNPLASQSKQDAHSLFGDAAFTDPTSGDYRVRDVSAVLMLGFKNFAMDQFGVKSPHLREQARTPKLPQPKSAD
jgi:hypothetical protein